MKVVYFKHARNIAILLLTFVAGVVTGLFTIIAEDPLKLIIPSLTTLVATFLGAYFAFRFQNKREEDKKLKVNVEAANRAIFTLARIVNELGVIKKQVIDPVRGRPDRFLAMQPFLIPSYEDIKIDIESLTFLLESKTPNILGELMVEESRFHQVINSLNNRSELHRYHVQPVLEAAGVRVGGQYRIAGIEKVLGQRVFVQIQNATDELIKHVDDTLLTSKTLIENFVSILKRIYPKSQFIRLDKQKEPNNAPQPTPKDGAAER